MPFLRRQSSRLPAQLARAPRTFLKVLRWTALSFAALVGLLIAVPVIIALLGISISAAPWRGSIADAASQALGRTVTLEGPLELIPTLRPTLTVGGIRVMNPPGFSAPEFAGLGAARLRLELIPLLSGRIQIVEVTAEDVRLRLEKTAEGRVNWQFQLPEAQTPAQPEASSSKASAVRLDSIAHTAYRHITVEYVAGGRSRYFALDEMEGTGKLGEPIALTLRGAVEKTFPYTVTITGGPLTGLYARDRPWPFELHLEFAGTALHLSGAVTGVLGNPAVDLIFGLGTQDLSEVERLLQSTFPPVGATALSGRVQWGSQRLQISNLRGVMGVSTLEGNLELDLAGSKPRVTGELMLPVLDLKPFLGGGNASPQPEQSTNLAQTAADAQKTLAELQKQSYSLKELGLMDVDLTLKVGRWLGIPGEVRDAELRTVIQGGKLKAPVHATVADVPLTGELNIDTTAEVPDFLLRLGAERSQLGRLAEVFARIHGVQGELSRLKLELKGRGDNLGAIVRTFDLRFDMTQGRLSYGNVEGGKPVDLRLDAFEIALPAGGRLAGRARGSLVGEAFQASFRGGDLPTLMRELRWPLELNASATGATVRVEGVLAAPEAERGTELRFRIAAARAGDVARWLGLSRTATASVAIEGDIRVESDEWHANLLVLKLGNTVMKAELARVGIGRQPLVQARLNADNIDVKELESMLPPPNPNAPKKSMIELPILPQGIDLVDADIDVKLKRIDMQPAPVSDISFSGRIREGKMGPSPFSANLGGTLFAGAIALDLRGQVPEASLWVAAEKVDVGGLLRQLKIVEDFESRVESMRVELIGRGSRLGEMLERSSLLAEMGSGQMVLRDPNRTIQLPIQVNKSIARAAPSQPITLDIDAIIDVTPIGIKISSGALPDFLKTSSSVPFSLAVNTAGAQIELKGKVALPISQRSVELELSARGERFDRLNQLAHVQLPLWGPWELGGRFRVSAGGYELPGLSVKVGESRLNGHGDLTTTGVRPRLNLDLTAPRVQLNDFKLDGWALVEKKEKKKDEKAMSVEELRARAKEMAAQGQKLLSPEVMRSLDATLNVDVEEVVSGQDKLGSGTLRAKLAEGRFTLDPAEVNVPGGSARVDFAYEPGETDVKVAATINVDSFDYGILARRAKPETDMQGLFSLHMQIDASAPTLDALMQHANGRVDFAVWPRNLKAGIFDLWAVNLLVALLPAVDPSNESKVNCAIGRFDLHDGKLTHERITLDTSRMRVNGQGRVDFETEELAFRLVPTAKSAQFFSLSTPIGVSGTITDFKIGVSGSDVLETTARLFTSVIAVPLQKLFGKSLPRDGGDVCGSAVAMRAAPAQ